MVPRVGDPPGLAVVELVRSLHGVQALQHELAKELTQLRPHIIASLLVQISSHLASSDKLRREVGREDLDKLR